MPSVLPDDALVAAPVWRESLPCAQGQFPSRSTLARSHWRWGAFHVTDARTLEKDLNNVPGVVENGLFLGVTWRVEVSEANGQIREMSR